MRPRSSEGCDLRIVSSALMTCCCRPITSRAGNARSHAAAVFAFCNVSAASLGWGVRNPDNAFIDTPAARLGAALPLPSAITAVPRGLADGALLTLAEL